jgi:catechol 2,3-dioxygenase-like lactoylglutathione lyase family enzyme
MKPVIDHIEITVKDMRVAVPFYDRLLPLLGFDTNRKVRVTMAEHDKEVVQYEHPLLGFAITSPRSGFANETVHRRRPGALHHLAFRADSRADVDRLHSELTKIGATIVSSPREYPEYTPPGYYAFFFKDPDGIKYEIVCTLTIDVKAGDVAESTA